MIEDTIQLNLPILVNVEWVDISTMESQHNESEELDNVDQNSIQREISTRST